MQATNTQLWPNRNVGMLAITGTITVIVATIVLAMMGVIPGVQQRNSVPQIVPQASADAAYTTESGLAYANVLRAQAAARQITSDMAYVLEADQLALQHSALAARLYLTSDEVYASEQAMMAEQSRHLAQQRGSQISPRFRP